MNWGGYGAVTQMFTAAKDIGSTKVLLAVGGNPMKGCAGVKIFNPSTTADLIIGGEDVTLANGFIIPPRGSEYIPVNPAETVRIYGIASATITGVRIAEILS